MLVRMLFPNVGEFYIRFVKTITVKTVITIVLGTPGICWTPSVATLVFYWLRIGSNLAFHLWEENKFVTSREIKISPLNHANCTVCSCIFDKDTKLAYFIGLTSSNAVSPLTVLSWKKQDSACFIGPNSVEYCDLICTRKGMGFYRNEYKLEFYFIAVSLEPTTVALV